MGKRYEIYSARVKFGEVILRKMDSSDILLSALDKANLLQFKFDRAGKKRYVRVLDTKTRRTF